jgi:DNA-binding MarR family transcriptional regulator
MEANTETRLNDAVLRPLQKSSLNSLLLDFGEDYQRRIMEAVHRRGHSLIRPAHCAVFGNLGKGAVRVSELAERAHVTQQALGKMLKELERIGYVVRDIDGSDRRAKKIRPTSRGDELMLDIQVAISETWDYYVARVGEDSLRQLEQLLAASINKLDILPHTESQPAVALSR